MKSRNATIDGLRTLAVAAVLFVHFKVPGFTGGFIGVDVFFVISGFLITRMIRREFEETGKFEFREFYAQRLRRLYPALLVTTAGSFVAASILMSPQELKAFAGSALASLAWFSNIYFWSIGGYFDADAATKPLLHTWSLSVEEQFYLIWPAIIIAAMKAKRRWAAPVAISILSLISLWLNFRMADGSTFLANRIEWLASRLQDGPSMLYFLTPFRLFEFGIGAAVVWADRLRRGEIANALAAVLGLAAMVGAAMTFSEEMTFPSYNALVPCVGAALVIFGRSAWVSRAVIGNWWMAAIGRRTYSIYLVHWPIWVFYGYLVIGEPPLWMRGVLCVASVGVGWLLYKFIEYPFYRGRFRIHRKPAVAGAAALSAIVIAAPAYSAWQSGWDWRINPHMRALITTASDEIEARFSGMIGASDACFASGGPGNYPADFPFDLCMKYQPGKKNILVLGDSIAAYSFPGLRADSNPETTNLMQNTLSGCRPLIGWGTKNCKARNDDFFGHIDRYRFDTLILDGYWEEKDLPAIRRTAAFLADHAPDAIIIGPSPRFERSLPDIFAVKQTEAAAINLAARSMLPGLFDLDAQMRSIADDYGVRYFSPLSQLCAKPDAASCRFVIDGKYLISFDTHHLMEPAAAFVFERLIAAIHPENDKYK